MSEGQKVVIVGAGVAGLTAADRLASRGAQVTVVERDDQVGGLARSLRYDGVTFDLGPHRFHTDDQEVLNYIMEVLDHDQRLIDRSSAVWLYNSYHDWPLARSSLLKLPPQVMIQASIDLFRRTPARNESLEDYILSRYGRTLYEIFFKPYTEKFLSYKCSDLHKDWASAGINRAVIDKRHRFDSLFQVARSTLLPSPVHTKFIYPETGGIDRFVEALVRRINDHGGSVLTSSPVIDVERDGPRITAVVVEGSRRLEADQVLWTAPLPLLNELLGQPKVLLKYLMEIIYNFVVDGPPRLPYQWAYYGGAALSFMRASQPSHFAPSNDGPGVTGVCVEVVCQENDDLWRNPSLIRRGLEHDLLRVKLIRKREDIKSMHFEKIREAYPIYALEYPGRLAQAVRQVSPPGSNVLLLGRTGTFWYNNMDHSIRQALDLVSALEQGMTAQRWNEELGASRNL